MTKEIFTQTLRDFTRRKPFIPFVFEMNDGRRIVIDQPFVAFAEGVAGYLSDEDGLIDISCEDVRAMTFLSAETAK